MTTSNAIETHIGDTISYAGIVNLPAGNWTASVITDVGTITATLSLVGPDSSDVTRNVWTLLLEASSTETAKWLVMMNAGKPTIRKASIRFSDDSVPPIVKTSEPFDVRVYG